MMLPSVIPKIGRRFSFEPEKKAMIKPRIKAEKKPKKIAMPPRRGIVSVCIFLWLGVSTAPILKASFIAAGVAKIVNKKAVRKEIGNKSITGIYYSIFHGKLQPAPPLFAGLRF